MLDNRGSWHCHKVRCMPTVIRAAVVSLITLAATGFFVTETIPVGAAGTCQTRVYDTVGTNPEGIAITPDGATA